MCCLPCTQPECLHRWESIEERKICRAVKELSSSKAARGTSRIELAHQSALYHSFHHLWHRKLNSFVKSTSTDNSVSFQNHKTECHSVINAQQHGVHRLFFSHVLFPESACAWELALALSTRLHWYRFSINNACYFVDTCITMVNTLASKFIFHKAWDVMHSRVSTKCFVLIKNVQLQQCYLIRHSNTNQV